MATAKRATAKRSHATVSKQRTRSARLKQPPAQTTVPSQTRSLPVRARQRTTNSAGRGAERRRAAKRPAWLRGPAPVVGTVVAVVAIIAIFVALANRSGAAVAGIGDAVPASVLSQVTQVPPRIWQAVGTGGLSGPYRALQGLGPLQGSGGKPQVLYVGAEYCPYCAAERWSMVVALSRFGTFSNLHYTASSGTDIYPNTRTFTFYQSSYTSPHVDFVAIENEDRTQQPLQALNSQQQQLFSSIGNNGYPFIDIANRYANGAGSFASGYDPAVLQGLDWQQIAAKLSNPSDPVTRAIVGNANYLTAALCQVTNQQPGNVCSTSTIQQIERQLPKGS